MGKRLFNPRSTLLCGLLAVGLVGGCDRLREQDMYYQAYHNPYEASAFYADGMSARPLVPGTVARVNLNGAQYYKDAQPGHPKVAETPGGGFPADFPTGGPDLQAKLDRGQQRYNIYCSVCHGMSGLGDGMVVQRGFTRPPPLVLQENDRVADPQRYEREEFLQKAPPQYFYNVITNGLGAMYGYAERVSPEDRWAIVAYIKALQATNPQAPPAQPPAGQTVPGATLKTPH